jgi:hypothetical protein
MFWQRIIIKSLSFGIGITILLSILALKIGNELVTQILLPPTGLLIYTIASPIPFGYDNQQNVIYEGNTLYPFAVIIGFFACILFYSLASFLILLIHNRHNSKTVSQ